MDPKKGSYIESSPNTNRMVYLLNKIVDNNTTFKKDVEPFVSQFDYSVSSNVILCIKLVTIKQCIQCYTSIRVKFELDKSQIVLCTYVRYKWNRYTQFKYLIWDFVKLLNTITFHTCRFFTTSSVKHSMATHDPSKTILSFISIALQVSLDYC